MSEFKASGFSDEFGSGGPDLVGVTTMTSPYYFVPPSGTTAERPESPPPGMLRFNTDIGRLEVWRNDHWATILGESSAPIGGRAITVRLTTIDYVTIATTGNSIDFGDQTSINMDEVNCCASSTRGILAGGYSVPAGNREDVIDFITIATLGDTTDFGNLTSGKSGVAALSDSTRGVFGGGFPATNAIDFITIASTGNAQDFGDMLTLNSYGMLATSSPTRGMFAGKNPTNNTVEYITIQSTGNAVDFGDLITARYYPMMNSSSTRALFAGNQSPTINTIEYVTIASTGNGTDYGDLTSARGGAQGTSSPTRGLFPGGGNTVIIDFVTTATLGDAQDFGDLTRSGTYFGSTSNAHGGL